MIPRDNFATADLRATLLSAFVSAYKAAASVIFLANTPASFPGDGETSVTPAWRNSIFHVTLTIPWTYNVTGSAAKSVYSATSAAADILRKITPDAAYQVWVFIDLAELVC